MNVLVIALVVGSIAAAADIIPMFIARGARTDILSAAVHWIVLALMFAYLRTPLPKWLEGAVFAVLSALPVMILVAPRDPGASLPMLVSSAVLGGLSGLALASALP